MLPNLARAPKFAEGCAASCFYATFDLGRAWFTEMECMKYQSPFLFR